jgi:hypothetical protein
MTTARRERELDRMVEAAIAPVKALVAPGGAHASFYHSLSVSVPWKPTQSVAFDIGVDGSTRLSSGVEGIKPSEAAALLRRLADVLDEPSLGPTCAEALARIPSPNGTTREYPPNFWE